MRVISISPGIEAIVASTVAGLLLQLLVTGPAVATPLRLSSTAPSFGA